MRKNLYWWGKNLIYVLADNGNTAFGRVANGPRQGENVNPPWNELSKTPPPEQKLLPKPEPKLKFDDPCPDCGTPDHISGIECPGCGFREWLESLDS